MSEDKEIVPAAVASSTSPDKASAVSDSLLEQAVLDEDGAPSVPGSARPAEQPETLTIEPLETSSPAGMAEPQAASTYNGCYAQSGSFTVGQTGRVVIRWRQAPPIKGAKYPPRSQAISFEIYKDGLRLTGWRLSGPAYLNNEGHVHLPVISPKGRSHLFRSPQSFFSEDFRALEKILDQFRAERQYIEKNGWSNLPFGFRNKRGRVVATKSTLLMGALIRKVGAKNIANSKKEPRPLADRIHDNILRMLNNKTMHGVVQRMAEAAGLQTSHHPTHGRSLIVPGQRTAAGAVPGATQYETNADLVMGAPLAPEFIDGLNRLAARVRSPRNPTDAQINEALRLYNQQFEGYNQETRFVDQMADYLVWQRRIFPNGVANWGMARGLNGIRFTIERLLSATTRFREGELNLDEYNQHLRDAAEGFELHAYGGSGHVPRNGMTGWNIVNLLLQMPGFEITETARRNNARELLVDAADRHLALLQMRREFAQIHEDLWDRILYIAGYLLIVVLVPKP